MKRVPITPTVERQVRRALGESVDFASMAIFEAIALNTRPLRKNHPLYKGARADVGLLTEMAAALAQESRPLHVEHSSDGGLPKGRVFHGEVLHNGSESELRVLFFLDASETEAIQKVETGTVDQVSVSILPKQILNSKSGFDYIGPESTFENIMSGTDNDGNTLNSNGVYARLVGLDSFFELSLVGQGGAQNARIVRREESHFGSSYQKLAASGLDPNALVLAATIEADKMDLTELINQLTDAKVSLASLTSDKSTLTADLAAARTQVEELTAKLAQLEAGNAVIDDLTAQLTSQTAIAGDATKALKDIATKLLTATGQVDATVPEDLPALIELINSTEGKLAAALVAGGRAKPADQGSLHGKPAADLTAFSTRK